MLTVEALIHQLQQYPPKSLVLVEDPRGHNGLNEVQRTRQGKAILNVHIGVFEGKHEEVRPHEEVLTPGKVVECVILAG